MNASDLAELRRLLAFISPATDVEAFADALGVESLASFEFVEARDIVEDTPLKAAPARRFLRSVEVVLKNRRSSARRALSTNRDAARAEDDGAFKRSTYADEAVDAGCVGSATFGFSREVVGCGDGSNAVHWKVAGDIDMRAVRVGADAKSPTPVARVLCGAHSEIERRRSCTDFDGAGRGIVSVADVRTDEGLSFPRDPRSDEENDGLHDPNADVTSGDKASDEEFDVGSLLEKVSDDSDGERPRKRRLKLYRDGKRHVAVRKNLASEGRAHVLRPEPYNRNSSLTGPGRKVSASVPAGAGCDCDKRIEALRNRFVGALRTGVEKKAMAESSSSKYNYARLQPLAIEFFSNASGNWCFHSRCIRKAFGFSSTWAPTTHAAAVKLFKCPTLTIPKKALGGNVADAMQRLVVRELCLLTPIKYLKSLDAKDEFVVIAEQKKLHGLVGHPSNNRKWQAMNVFEHFVRGNRALNGRTPDEHGRFHGARFYPDARFLIYRKKVPGEARMALCV